MIYTATRRPSRGYITVILLLLSSARRTRRVDIFFLRFCACAVFPPHALVSSLRHATPRAS